MMSSPLRGRSRSRQACGDDGAGPRQMTVIARPPLRNQAGRQPAIARLAAPAAARVARPADIPCGQRSVTASPTGPTKRQHGAQPGRASPEPDPVPAIGLPAGLLSGQPGNALRAAAGTAGARARPAAPAGGQQAGQPGCMRQQLGSAAIARDRGDEPDPAAGQGKPLPRPMNAPNVLYGRS
jgi:hypothetical protein